jgi:hypothetical protein
MEVSYDIHKSFPQNIEEELAGLPEPRWRTVILEEVGTQAIRRLFFTGGFESIRKISNVEHFELEILVIDEDLRFGYQTLHRREIEIVEALKHDVEANFHLAARTSRISI